MSTAVSIIATFIPKPGKEKQVEEILRGMIAPSRAEAGNQRYELHSGTLSSAMFVLIEMYKDEAAVEAHRAGEYYKAFRERIPEFLSEPIKIQLLRSIDANH
jgi:quinol monooxygenase YgiN